MLKKQVLIGLLLSIIISLAFVPIVKAYSLYDFVSYIQSLFTGGGGIKGGPYSDIVERISDISPTSPSGPHENGKSITVTITTFGILGKYYAVYMQDPNCNVLSCPRTDWITPNSDGKIVFTHIFTMWDRNVDVNFILYGADDQYGNGKYYVDMRTIKFTSPTPTSSKDRECTSNNDCVSTSSDFPTCDITTDKNTAGFKSICMKCQGKIQAPGSGFNWEACEKSCDDTVDTDCDGIKPGNVCVSGPPEKRCDSNCKCLSVSTTSSSTTSSTSTSTGTSSSTTTTTQTCPNPRTSAYSNTLCRSDATCPSLSTTTPTPIKNSDNTYTITFKSTQVEEVNVFVDGGRIIEILSGRIESYGKAPAYVQTTDDICPPGITSCNPSIIAKKYCDFLKDGRIVYSPGSYLDEMARALLPLRLSEKSGNMNTASIKVNHTSSNPMTVYYLYYYDKEGYGNYSKCLEGTKCSKDECDGKYSGCSGDDDPSGGKKLTVNSVICAKTTSGVQAWYSCWHAPWELAFPTLTISSPYAPPTTACSQTCINNGYPNGGNCRVGTACASGENNIGIDGCPTNNLCCCYYTSPTITPTTQTGTPTTATVTITTTPTTPILPPLPLHCNDCGVGTKCSCELDTTCSEGIWIVKNKDGKPLTVPVVTDIPPIKVEFTPDAKGTVDAIAICFRSDQTLFVRVNKTSAEVKEAMVNCPRQCSVYSECTCTVNFCNSGMFTVFVEDKLLTSTKFKGTFTGKFTPDTVGTAEVRVDCDDPARSSKVQVTITGTTATTTTTPTSEKKFTGTDFKCSSSGDDRTCSLKYTNKYGTVYLSFVFINSDGDVKYITDPSITIGNGSGTKSDTYTCKGSGSLKVRWVAFSKKDKSGPIAWSTTSEEQRVAC